MFRHCIRPPLRVLIAVACSLSWTAATTATAVASYYSGDGIREGVQAAANAGVSDQTDLRLLIETIMRKILTYVSLAAVVAIIIAGFYLILGMGNDTAKDTAKKIILYVIIGLIVIIISAGIVNIILDAQT